MEQPVKSPIFMIAMPRSGTTAISEVLSLHGDLGWLSNAVNRFPGFPWVAFFDRLASNSLSGELFRGKKKQDRRFSSKIYRFLPYSIEAIRYWQWFCGDDFYWDYLLRQVASTYQKERLLQSLSIILHSQGKKRFFSKLTGPSRIHYLTSIFPDACFIHIVRDPRAVVLSLLRASFWRQKGGFEKPWWKNGLLREDLAEWDFYERSPVALAAIQWKRVVEVTWEEKKFLDLRQFIEVRYEEFTEIPHDILRKVLEKFDLADSKQAHKYLDSKGSVTNMNHKVEDKLSVVQREIVENITRETAERAGYRF